MSKRWKNTIGVVSLAASIALVLWLTLFSRIGSDSRYFYPPFWSYRAILNGSGKALVEDIGNIILFIPIGVTLVVILRFDVKKSLLVGFTLSLIIESCQWFFWLGSFEIDDLIHNMIGAGIGAALINHTEFGEWFSQQIQDKAKSLCTMACILILLMGLSLGYHGLKGFEMRRLASLNNREDGAVNLLVLSPDPVYIGQTNVIVTYNADGSILIAGESDSRAWIHISRFTLPAGAYVLEGMSGIEKYTVGLELAIYDNKQQKYVMLGHEVGAIDTLEFSLQQTSKLEVLISIYPNWEGSVLARPVIYQGV